jgi:pyruvate formate lyase activating enzyme
MLNKKDDISKREFLKRSLTFSAGLICFPCPAIFSDTIPEQKSIYRRIAMFQEETARGIMCRKVYNSKLYTLAFGNPCSVNIDPVEKKPLYHFLPGSRTYSIATAGCNLVCLNCQNWTISQTSPDKTRNYDLMPERVVKECIDNKCSSIAYTYSEPVTFYEYVFETATLAKEAGIKNIIKSNGYINEEPLKKLGGLIDGVNIDLKAFSESTYLKLTGGKLQPVLDTLKVYKDLGVWLEITNLVVPTWTDDLDEIRKMCRWLSDNGFRNTPIHFSRFYPIHKLEQLPPTPVEILNSAASIASDEGIKYVYTGNVPGNELSNTFCPSCKSVLIERQGFRIASNTIAGGKCNKCGQTIDGVWN